MIHFVKKNVRLLQATAAVVAILAAFWSFAGPVYKNSTRKKPIENTFLIPTLHRFEALQIIRQLGGPNDPIVKPELFEASTEWPRGRDGAVLVFYTKNHDECVLIKSGVQIINDDGLVIPIVQNEVNSIKAPVGYNVTVIPVIVPSYTPLGEYKIVLTATYSCGIWIEDIEFNRPTLMVTEETVE